MKKASYLFILVATLGFTLMVSACQKEQPAEKAGEQVDQTMDQNQGTTQDMMDEQGPMEEAGKKMDQAVDQSKEMMDNAVDNTKDMMDKSTE